ncbi:ketoacyl-ACP synthase III [uncultured Mailhella sp.]|uniref:ketoacyl-ACP synthase III n=1 Tax=uncultured Mailhella sp. TaxID=1981031 RepID=UPI00262AAC46|nr:ketoacyl-ACP synthase III [uncultured Mailhella sp.]
MSRTCFTHVKISGVTCVVPENFIRIEDELKFFHNDVKLLERNKKILGLGKRHVADERTTNADLCEAAARDLLAALGVDKGSIDALIVVSTSHDYHYPASACILQGRLGLSEDCTCFDIGGLSCSAYVHGLWTAHSLIAGGAAKKCLVLAGEIASLHSDRRNRNSNMLFGDAGTATLLEYTAEERPAFFVTGTRGRDWDKLIAPAGGYNLPMRADIAGLEITDDTGNVWRLCDDIMKGIDVFRFTTDVGPKGIRELLEFSGKTLEDVDYFAFHQANKQIVRTVAMYAGVPRGKWSAEAFSEYGNCGAAAVVVDICRELGRRPVKNLCMATFGVGLSWGFCLVDMEGSLVAPVREYVTPEGKMNRKEKIDYWISYFREGNHA